MPYKIKKVKGGYKVCKKDDSKCFSDDPMTKEDAKDQMQAMYANESVDSSNNFDRLFNEMMSITLESWEGLSAGMTIDDIANKHKVDVSKIKSELSKGQKIEYEHTSDKEEAKKIAMDHLVERPDYYSKLDRYVEK